MSLSASAARGSAFTLAGQAVRLLLMLATTIVLSRLLAPNVFGLMAMVLAVSGVAQIFLDFGLSTAALQAKNLTHAQQSNLFWINAAVGIALAALLYALAVPISWMYNEPDVVPLIRSISLFYVASGFAAQFRVKINRDLKFGLLALTDILPATIALGAACALAASGFGVASLVVQQLCIAFFTLIFAIIFARWWPSLPKRGQNMHALLSFGTTFALTQLLSYAAKNIDSVLIGRFNGSAALGQYDRAFQISVVPVDRINAPLTKVAIPILSRVADNKVEFLAWLRKAQLIACYGTATLFAVLCGLGSPIVSLLMGPGWETAGVILSVLALSGIFRSITQISYWMFISQGFVRQQLNRFLVTQPLTILAMIAGLHWGPVGVAWGNVVGYAATWAISLVWAARVSGLPVKPLLVEALRVVIVIGAPVAVLTYAIARISDFSNWMTVLLGLAGALTWIVIACIIFEFVRKDVRFLMSFARKSLRGD